MRRAWQKFILFILFFEENVNSNLGVEEIKGHLQSDGFHIRFIQCARDVHVQVEESIHDATQFGLFHLQLREQIDEPFETALVAVNPEKVNLQKKQKKQINFSFLMQVFV